MNLIWFLTIGTVLSIIFGEFGQFPFASTFSFSLTDILLGMTTTFLLIWKIGIKKEVLLPQGFKALLIFWVIALISLLFSGNLGGIFYLLRFMLYSFAFYIGYILIKESRVKALWIINLVLVTAALFALLGFMQLIFYPDLSRLEEFGYDPHKYRLVSTFLDPNFAGVLLNLGLIISLYFFTQKKELKWFNFSAGFLIAVILTFSRSSYLLMIVSLALLGIEYSKKLLLGLIIGSVLVFAFIPRVQERIEGIWQLDITVKDRLESYNAGFVIIKDSPILGVGFNNIGDALQEYNLLRTHQSSETHSSQGIDSSFLFVLATTGILGFSSYLFFWGFVLLKLFKGGKLSKAFLFFLVGLFVNSQFINSLSYPSIMLFIFLTSGALYANDEKN